MDPPGGLERNLAVGKERVFDSESFEDTAVTEKVVQHGSVAGAMPSSLMSPGV